MCRPTEPLDALRAMGTKQNVFRTEALGLIHRGQGLKEGWVHINPPAQQHQQFNEDVLSHPY